MWGFGDEERDGEERKRDEFFELKSSQLWRKLPTLNTEVGTLDLFFSLPIEKMQCSSKDSCLISWSTTCFLSFYNWERRWKSQLTLVVYLLCVLWEIFFIQWFWVSAKVEFFGAFFIIFEFFIVSLSIPVFDFCTHVKGISFCALWKWSHRETGKILGKLFAHRVFLMGLPNFPSF